jgi:hypothetical protein
MDDFFYSEAAKLKAIIAKYRGRYYDLSSQEQTELNKAVKELEQLQKRCTYHNWFQYVLFNGTYRECRQCGIVEQIDLLHK